MTDSPEGYIDKAKGLPALSSEFLRSLPLDVPLILALPSEQTMRHRRSVMLLSLTILLALLTDTIPTKIETLGIEFGEHQKPYFIFAAAAAMLYQLAMYVVHWNRDQALYCIQIDSWSLAFSTRAHYLSASGLTDGVATPEALEAWQTEAKELANQLMGAITSWHRKLHIRLLRYVPALLVATAVAFLATEYMPAGWSTFVGACVLLGTGASRWIAHRQPPSAS